MHIESVTDWIQFSCDTTRKMNTSAWRSSFVEAPMRFEAITEYGDARRHKHHGSDTKRKNLVERHNFINEAERVLYSTSTTEPTRNINNQQVGIAILVSRSMT
ncbi:hypothetical protein YC2023_052998 [Brassica napus]